METQNGHTHVHRDDEGDKLGMWLFIFTELLLLACCLSFMPFTAIKIR